MNLFKHIFWKNFPKTQPEKLADDLGPMKGYVNIRQIDPITGKFVRNHGQFNTLVNGSKSNLIRLISQGQSTWLGTIDPTKLKITKMRFGNNGSSGTPNSLLYYDIAEPSARPSTPAAGILAGGLPSAATIPAQASSIVSTDIANVAGNYTIGATSNLKIYTIRNGDAIGTALSDHSPSPGTFKVELKYGGTVAETLYFYDTVDASNILKYPKGGIYPYKISTVSVGNDQSNRIIAPNLRQSSEGGNVYSQILQSSDDSQTFLYYDYTAKCWKLQLEELSGRNTLYDTVTISYKRGLYNVINGIIPVDGYNVGTGVTVPLRYAYNTKGDAYSVLSNLEYRDGDTDDVDDYSVTFSTIMSGQSGNGRITDVSQYINYQEAFLFNERDDMFSALYLSTPFDKNQLTAFFISWTILAPL